MRIYKECIEGRDVLCISYPLRRPKQFARLTPAEADVVEAALAGRSHASIALMSGLSVRTVSNQLVAAYAKLDVNSFTELCSLCFGGATGGARCPNVLK